MKDLASVLDSEITYKVNRTAKKIEKKKKKKDESQF